MAHCPTSIQFTVLERYSDSGVSLDFSVSEKFSNLFLGFARRRRNSDDCRTESFGIIIGELGGWAVVRDYYSAAQW